MGPVLALVLAFIVLSLLAKHAWEKIELFLRSNYKYLFLESLASYVHYGEDIGIEASLKLDGPTREVYERRLEGQGYLASKLGGAAAGDDSPTRRRRGGGGGGGRGRALAPSLVDCRFALAKVCMPLLRELEFSPDDDGVGRNFVSGVRNVAAASSSPPPPPPPPTPIRTTTPPPGGCCTSSPRTGRRGRTWATTPCTPWA